MMTQKALIVGLIGNPNCGKTTLFNALTNTRQQVGNWPGVTVERKTGRYGRGASAVTVVDLPGVYSLGVTSFASVDEQIARDFALSDEADLIVNIVDASNLERNLYLTAQLIEMRVPMIVALNMMDVARARRTDIDVEGLATRLGCPVVPMVAARGEGVQELKAAITRLARDPRPSQAAIGFAAEIESEISALQPVLAAGLDAGRTPDLRWLAVKMLEGDEAARRLVSPEARAVTEAAQARIAERLDEDPDILIADGRYGFANQIMREFVRQAGRIERTTSDRIDRIVLHRLLGLPIFLGVIYLLFLFSVNFGSAFIDFFDQIAAAFLVDGLAAVLDGWGWPNWLVTLLTKGVGGGIQTVATFIPIIACLYIFLSFLEDCGYMARAAFVMDRVMRAVGLPGKSFIPLIVGFGCNVPAIMATRTLENRRDRTMTVMMAPFMSCGARLPVYALFAAAFFPENGHNLVFALYVIGIGFAVLTGLVLKRTLLQGETTPFVMELPPYHLPTLRGLAIRTWDRLSAFMIRAGRVIIGVVIVLSFFSSIGTDGSFNNEDSERSMLAAAGRAITPALAPMGITQDNWPATVGLLTGLLAKETVVGTLNALYGNLSATGEEDAAAEEEFELGPAVTAAFATIPANLAELAGRIADPLGLDIVGEGETIEEAAAHQEVSTGTFSEMAARFDGQLGAFAYLLAVLLYMPCASAIAAIQRETGWKWTIFACLWTTGLGYGSAVLVYQAGRFSEQPAVASAWITIILVTFAACLVAFRLAGSRSPEPAPAA